jgi:hypothetical protein
MFLGNQIGPATRGIFLEQCRRKGRLLGKSMTFDKVLDMIDALPAEQRESLIEIVRSRLIEERRDRLASSIRKARKEYERGKISRGTVDNLMDELSR